MDTHTHQTFPHITFVLLSLSLTQSLEALLFFHDFSPLLYSFFFNSLDTFRGCHHHHWTQPEAAATSVDERKKSMEIELKENKNHAEK